MLRAVSSASPWEHTVRTKPQLSTVGTDRAGFLIRTFPSCRLSHRQCSQTLPGCSSLFHFSSLTPPLLSSLLLTPLSNSTCLCCFPSALEWECSLMKQRRQFPTFQQRIAKENVHDLKVSIFKGETVLWQTKTKTIKNKQTNKQKKKVSEFSVKSSV